MAKTYIYSSFIHFIKNKNKKNVRCGFSYLMGD